MSERLKHIENMAIRYNELGVVSDETLAAVMAANDLPEMTLVTGSEEIDDKRSLVDRCLEISLREYERVREYSFITGFSQRTVE